MNFEKLVISEKNEKYFHFLKFGLKQHSIEFEAFQKSDRFFCKIAYNSNIQATICSLIIDIICIGYSFDFLQKNVQVFGCSAIEIDILFAGIIACMYELESRKVFDKLKTLFMGNKEFSIDGLYLFEFAYLKREWQNKIKSLSPIVSAGSVLDGFLNTVFEIKTGAALLVENRLYDLPDEAESDKVVLPYFKALLIQPDRQNAYYSLFEIILNNVAELHCDAISTEQDRIIRKYFGTYFK